MQRGRLGGIPLPRTFPIRGGGIGSMMVVRYSRLPGRAGTVWRRSVLLLREGAPPYSPRGATPASRSLKNKKVRTPSARVSLTGRGVRRPASLAD
jgi:tRNA U34 5-methylaminomethyl-2-thiouridine-forming methyltransferase MnmC